MAVSFFAVSFREPGTKKRLPHMRQPLGYYFSKEPYALSTLPERRQRVQTFIDLGVPSTTTLTLCTLACCVVSARLEICERVILIFLPKNISFWQTSHLAMQTPPVRIQMPKNNTTTDLRVQQVFRLFSGYITLLLNKRLIVTILSHIASPEEKLRSFNVVLAGESIKSVPVSVQTAIS